jgi:hypothetical protein
LVRLPNGLPIRASMLLIVVVEILVAERDPEHPLTHQSRHTVLDQLGTPRVVKARRKPIHQINRPTVAPRSNAPASDVTNPPSNAASTGRPFTVPKSNDSALHSVGIWAPLESSQSRCSTMTFADSEPQCALFV